MSEFPPEHIAMFVARLADPETRPDVVKFLREHAQSLNADERTKVQALAASIEELPRDISPSDEAELFNGSAAVLDGE